MSDFNINGVLFSCCFYWVMGGAAFIQNLEPAQVTKALNVYYQSIERKSVQFNHSQRGVVPVGVYRMLRALRGRAYVFLAHGFYF